jgi:outer membrane protein assembly factor BamA
MGKRRTKLVARTGVWAVLTLAMPVDAAFAQPAGDAAPPAVSHKADSSPQGFFNNPSFLVVPIPVSNPTIGSGGAIATAMFFKTDEVSKSSFIGGGAFYTNNGSWGAAALTEMAFDEDRYRSRGMAGYANVNYDFYGTRSTNADNQRHVALNQGGALFQLGVEGRVAPQFYVGGRLRYMTIKTNFAVPDDAGDLLGRDGPLSNLKDSVLTTGLTATYDSRNKDYSPSEGSLLQGGLDIALNDFIRRESFSRVTLNLNHYDTLMDDLVLASHGSFCGESGRVPIFDLCLFGSQNDLRGYAVGHYQDKTMFTLQEELRWHAFWRVGFVAFAGLGSVAPSIGRFDKLLYSGGVGMRFLASREYGVNIGIDGAVNAQGQTTYYIQVGEAF